jgi:S1-C subfamily serine protease
VEAATIRLLKQRGQGVLVRGGYVLTAAHCVKWTGTGGMALGDYFIEPFETSDGHKLQASVHAAEPVADIAVLGPPDDQAMPKEYVAFGRYVETTNAVSLRTHAPEIDKPIPAWVFAHTGEWISGRAVNYGFPGGVIWLLTDSYIEGGASGSPVVDEAGHLIGLISHSGERLEHDGSYSGQMPMPWLALPRWLLDRIGQAT